MKDQRKNTVGDASYWNGNGAYSSEVSIHEKLIPIKGTATTLHAEIVRIFTNLVHEFNNNGNGNIIKTKTVTIEHTCWECGGNGEIEVENEIGEFEEECCWECEGSGEIEEDDEVFDGIVPYMMEDLLYLKDFLVTNNESLTNYEALVDYIGNSGFDINFQEGNKYYNALIDQLMYVIGTTRNKSIERIKNY